MIHYLIYLSAASHLYSEDEMKELLAVSRSNNSEKDITGILLYHEGSILQVLEGEKEIIHQLFAKIERDNRHKNVIVMTEGINSERSFEEWSMGFKAIDKNDWKEYEGYFKLNTSSLLSIIKKRNNRVDMMLTSFMKTNTG